MKNIKLLHTVLALAFVFSACTKKAELANPKTPEQVVRDFIELSATAKTGADKAKLEQLCTGEMRRAFERMTEETFQLSYLSNNVTIKNIEFLKTETPAEPNQAVVRYKVTIENNGGTDPTAEVNEREVELSLSSGQWFLEHIRPRGQDSIAFTRGMIF